MHYICIVKKLLHQISVKGLTFFYQNANTTQIEFQMGLHLHHAHKQNLTVIVFRILFLF